jgi:hypothetical protein
MSAFGPLAPTEPTSREVGLVPILLQKSKVATPRIFREDKRWETIADSYTLNRVAEIAGEFDARGHVPPHLYTEDAPTARRIFDHLCKTTFATVSSESDRLTAPQRDGALCLNGDVQTG